MATNLGHFLGGVADERAASAERGLRERALGLQEEGLGLQKRRLGMEEQQLETASLKEQVAAGQQSIAEITKLAAEAKKNSRDGAPKVIAGMRNQIATTAQMLDGLSDRFTPQDIMARFDAAIQATPTAVEAGELEGEAAGAKAEASAPGEAARAEQVSAATARGTAAGSPAKAPNTRTYFVPGSGFTSVDVNAPDATNKINDIIARGGFQASAGVQATTSGDLGVTGETPESIDAVRETLRSTVSQLGEIDKTVEMFAKTPQAGGITGTVIEKLGGIIEQIPVIGEDVADTAGLKTEEVTKARTQARITVSQLLSTITGEESGRFTDREREIAEEAQKTLDPTASASQIRAAMQQTRSILQRSQDRELARLLSASGADLTGDEGVEKFYDILLENQFSDEQALDAIIRLQDRLGISPMGQ